MHEELRAALTGNFRVLPQLRDLPVWVKEFRPHQVDAIIGCLTEYASGCRVVVLDAPTGSGKTLIAEAVRRLLRLRGVYVCTTKTLQAQMDEDYPMSVMLKGRSNYPTMRADLYGTTQLDITAADCTKQPKMSEPSCQWCSPITECPYEIAKHGALAADLAVLNTAYFLTEANGPGRFSEREFVVVDEADTLERELMGYVAVEVSRSRVKELKLGEPKRVTNAQDWQLWIDQALPKVEGAIKSLPPQLLEEDVRQIRRKKWLVNLRDRLTEIRDGVDSGEWIYTGKHGEVSFKPIHVDEDAKRLLWPHSKRWLLMSATVISPDEMLGSLGWDEPFGYVSCPSTFPVERRPVKAMAVADMSRKGKEAGSWELMADAVARVIARHTGERVLVHTVSYDLARTVADTLHRATSDRAVATYFTGRDRESALHHFQKTPGSILVAPSMDRGVDLPYDACGVVVIAKVPFPYLGDRQVAARLYSHGGEQWYATQAMRTLVQMCGRGMRAADDHCTTYILDSNFAGKLWRQGRGLWPQWWVDAIDWRDSLLTGR